MKDGSNREYRSVHRSHSEPVLFAETEPVPFWQKHAHGRFRSEGNQNSEVTNQAIFGHMTTDGQIARAGYGRQVGGVAENRPTGVMPGGGRRFRRDSRRDKLIAAALCHARQIVLVRPMAESVSSCFGTHDEKRP